MPPLDRPLTTLTDLDAAWRFVDGGHGYSVPQLFVLVLDRHDHAIPHVIQFYDEEHAGGPDDVLVERLVEHLAAVVDDVAPGGAVAMMKARPGRSPVLSTADRRWCHALHRALRAAPFGSKPLYFACDDGPRIVAPDELLGA